MLVRVLETNKGKDSRWAAAAVVSDEELKAACMQATAPPEEMLEERGVELPTMRAEV